MFTCFYNSLTSVCGVLVFTCFYKSYQCIWCFSVHLFFTSHSSVCGVSVFTCFYNSLTSVCDVLVFTHFYSTVLPVYVVF